MAVATGLPNLGAHVTWSGPDLGSFPVHIHHHHYHSPHLAFASSSYLVPPGVLQCSILASIHNISTKYNIIIRLWTHGFHKLVESLQHASFMSLLSFKHLQDFIYYAYTFYTGILEEQSLCPFCAGWLKALGDIARYRMAVVAVVMYSQGLG